jgi:hypothetical protein
VDIWGGQVKQSLLAGEPRNMFVELVRTWERLLLANAPAKGSGN